MITESVVQSTTITNGCGGSASAVREQRDYLTQLDSAIGDGDHGLNMSRGFDSVTKALAAQDDSLPPGRLLIVAGKTLVSTDRRSERPAVGHGPAAGRSRARRRGRVRRLDGLDRRPGRAPSTGWSSWAPPDRGQDDGRRTGAGGRGTTARDRGRAAAAAVAVTAAAEAAEEGMRATIPMQARKGRASYLGERSVGHQDPGATSTALIIRALEAAVAAEG